MELERLNPWWKGREYIRHDKHIRDFESKPLKWHPPLLKEFKPIHGNIYTLRGPRQVGKTTLVKLIIAHLLQDGKKEQAIFFWNCEELTHFRELSAMLQEYLTFANMHGAKDKYIFLDEISRVKDWQRSLKFLADSGELEDSCIFVTGSNMLDIKYGAERMPGRTGKQGKDLLLLPMTFREYVELVKPEIASKIRKAKTMSNAEMNKAVLSVKPYAANLKELFSQYLVTGGFPLVINEFFSNKKIPDYIYEIYFRWIAGDITKWGKQEKILVQILRSVIVKQSTAISWDSLAKDAEVKSHKTVSSYIEMLEGMFALNVLYFIDISKKTADYAKNKKVYFSDPFIHHIFNRLLFFKENETSPALIEAAVVSHLARQFAGIPPKIFYWKNSKEVDAVLDTGKGLVGVEVKYQKSINKEDYRGLHYFKQGFMLTADYTELKDKYPAYPVHLFLAVI